MHSNQAKQEIITNLPHILSSIKVFTQEACQTLPEIRTSNVLTSKHRETIDGRHVS